MAVSVRDAEEKDIDAIAASHNSAWRRAYRDLFPDEYLDDPKLLERQRHDWVKRFAQPNLKPEVVVAEINGIVVGFCSYQTLSEQIVELTGLYVNPIHWSTGTGTALQRAARDRWKAAGCREAFLWVATDNPRAHRSYKKNGWTRTGEAMLMSFDGYEISVEKLTLDIAKS